jgi:hypothetical protein
VIPTYLPTLIPSKAALTLHFIAHALGVAPSRDSRCRQLPPPTDCRCPSSELLVLTRSRNLSSIPSPTRARTRSPSPQTSCNLAAAST